MAVPTTWFVCKRLRTAAIVIGISLTPAVLLPAAAPAATERRVASRGRMYGAITAAVLLATLAFAPTASADKNDIGFLDIDSPLTGTSESVTVEGVIGCETSIDFGLIVTAQQRDGIETFRPGVQIESATAEAVGAFGPAFPPLNTNRCPSFDLGPFDVVVEHGRDSGPFRDGLVDVQITAGTSAENGARGPGPIVGDVATVYDFVPLEIDGAGASAAARGCQTIRLSGERYVMYESGPSCRSAKRKIKRLHRTGRVPARYDCRSSDAYESNGYCTRNGRAEQFGWYRGD